MGTMTPAQRRALYESVGFRPDGRMVHGEIVYQLVWEP